MILTEETQRCYCDACGKLIYVKDCRSRIGALPTDFYEVIYDSYDNPNGTASRDPVRRKHRDVCSEKCLYEKVFPLYFMRVDAKNKSIQNTEGITIRHRGYV